jgi:hypothetical protein
MKTWFEQKEKYIKTLAGVRLQQGAVDNLTRLRAVTGFMMAEQVEMLLPKALEEAVQDPEFLRAEQAKGGARNPVKHAGGRPAKTQAAGAE